MTWLTRDTSGGAPPGERLREMCRRPGVVRLPGAHNALAALLAKDAGFDALYVSGAGVSATLGLADLGIMALDELCAVTRTIHRAVGLPLVVDADTGYGGVLNVMRTVRELEAAGAAAMQIEDQAMPKKCGHLSDKRLVGADEMAAKVGAAARARSHLFIVARTDAVASEGVEAAIGRARLYVEAGADAIFPEALPDAESFRAFAGALDVPLLANMAEFGRTPFFTADEFEALGVKMVIWPVSALRVALKAMAELYAGLMADGATTRYLERMYTRQELYDLIGYHDYEALDDSIARSTLPDAQRFARADGS